MYGPEVDHGSNREYVLRSDDYSDMLRNPSLLLDCVEREVITSYEAALLMCPCNPNRSTGYDKLITLTVEEFNHYTSQAEEMNGGERMTLFYDCTKRIEKIWGLWDDGDETRIE